MIGGSLYLYYSETFPGRSWGSVNRWQGTTRLPCTPTHSHLDNFHSTEYIQRPDTESNIYIKHINILIMLNIHNQWLFFLITISFWRKTYNFHHKVPFHKLLQVKLDNFNRQRYMRVRSMCKNPTETLVLIDVKSLNAWDYLKCGIDS